MRTFWYRSLKKRRVQAVFERLGRGLTDEGRDKVGITIIAGFFALVGDLLGSYPWLATVAFFMAIAAVFWCGREIAKAGFRLDPRDREKRRLRFRTISRVGGASLALAVPACLHAFVGTGESYLATTLSRIETRISETAQSAEKAQDQATIAADEAIKSNRLAEENQAILKADRQTSLAQQLSNLLIDGNESTIAAFLDKGGALIGPGTVRQALQQVSNDERPVIAVVADRTRNPQSIAVFSRLFGRDRFDANDVITDRDHEMFIERQPLWYALRYANLPMVRTLLQAGAYPHPAQTVDGRWNMEVEREILFPLEWMDTLGVGTSKDRIEIAKLLREHGLAQPKADFLRHGARLCPADLASGIAQSDESKIRKSLTIRLKDMPRAIVSKYKGGSRSRLIFQSIVTSTNNQLIVLTSSESERVMHSSPSFDFFVASVRRDCRVPGEGRFADCRRLVGWGFELRNGKWGPYQNTAHIENDLKSVEAEYSC
ncbi:MAG: hypothetical protein ACKVOP_13955 [Sphingomonadaceae bacterium]